MSLDKSKRSADLGDGAIFVFPKESGGRIEQGHVVIVDGVPEDFSLGAGGDGEFGGEEGGQGITGAVLFAFWWWTRRWSEWRGGGGRW